MSIVDSSVRNYDRPQKLSQRFSWVFLGACYWLILGITLDTWAHRHVKLDSFFTPWHGVLYSGLLAAGLALPGAILVNRQQHGLSWSESIPRGYDLAVLGLIGALIGGIGDMVWHIFFGVEQVLDAQFSPTHIALMLFFGFIVVSPFRALHISPKPTSAILIAFSYNILLTYWSLISPALHPYGSFWLTNTPKTDETGQALAIASYLVQGAFLATLTMYTIRRWRLFFGFFTFTLTLNAITLAVLKNHLIVIPIGLIAGILIDCVYHFLRPSLEKKEHFRIFIALVPGIWFLTYTTILTVIYRSVWSIHMLVGSVVVTSLLAWLISGLMFPLPLPDTSSSGEQ